MDGGNASSVFFCVFCMHVTFYMLQGSDPGYLGPHNCPSSSPDEEGDDDPEMTTIDLNDASIEDINAVIAEDDDDGRTSIDLRHSSSYLNGDSAGTKMDFFSDPADDEMENATMVTSMPSCDLCGINPPLRSRHCRFVDCCVAGYDHYCIMTGTCIGERNICRFWWFLFVHAASVWYGIGLVHHAFSWQSNSGLWWRVNMMAFIAAIMFWCGFCCSVPLFCAHSWFAATNTTGNVSTVPVSFFVGLIYILSARSPCLSGLSVRHEI